MTMQASPVCPFDNLHWTAQEIADAVPLRLHQIALFDATSHGDTCASNEPRQRLRIAHGYRRDAAPAPRFRIS